MSMMITELYDALSGESPATKADTNRIDRRLVAIEGELLLLKWMSGLLLAGVASLILKSCFL